MTAKKPSSTRRRTFVKGTAAGAAIAPFFIGRPALAADEPEFTLKFATVAPSGTPWHKLAKRFKKHVGEQSEGRIKVKTYLGGALGDEISTAEATKRGTIQGWGGSMGALASAVPELSCLELPYLFKSAKQAYTTLDKTRDELSGLLESRGYKLAVFSQNGFRSIGSTFPIHSMADLKGRKMRSLQNDVHLATWKAFGAAPTPLAITELLSSLQTGVVDGFDNTPLFTFAAALYMATTHFTVTEHIFQPACVVYSMKFWESLPKELQEALTSDDEAMRKMESRGIRSIIAMRTQLLANFEAAGIVVTNLDKSEMGKFRSASEKVHAGFEKSTSAEGKKLLKSVKAAL